MRTLVAFGLVLALSSACVGPADRAGLSEERRATDALEPSLAPLATDANGRREGPGTTTGTPASQDPTSTPGDPGPQSGDRTAPGPTGTPGTRAPATPSEVGTARLRDPVGDVTGFGSPDWADLRGARLVGNGPTFTLTHVLAGPAPREGDGQETMNIATFFDVDGDGNIDYEIWANLSPEGWGTSYFDERQGTARYAADDDVDVEVVDTSVQLRFPVSHLGEAPSFRWSIASEYGPYEAIGTDAMARDYLPDDRSGRPFPG